MKHWKSLLTAAVVAPVMALAPKAEANDLTVSHWGVLMYGAPFAVAQANGWFEEEGIEVTGFITSQGGGTTLRNALASPIPYGEASLAAVIAAAQQGVDLTIVHGGVQSVGDILWIKRPDDDSINGIEDLVGKSVSYTSPRSVSEMLLIMSLDAVGISMDQVDAQSLGGVGAGLTALNEGAIDAAIILEPVWTANRDRFVPVFSAGEILPPVMQTVGVVRTDYLQANPETIAAIVRARMRGVEAIYADPEAAGRILAEAYEMDEDVAIEAIRNVAALEYWSAGAMDRESMDNMVMGLRIVDAIPDEPVDWSTLIDESLLPEHLRLAN